MIDRLRFLLDRPLDPLAARTVVVFATTILLGFGVLFVIGMSESNHAALLREQAVSDQGQPRPSRGAARVQAASPPQPAPHRRRQDPQDEKNSPAGRRSMRALQSHRALQHVPYRQGRLIIQLVGARGGRAVLRVSAPSIFAGQRGWRRFLRLYDDSGRAYLPRFKVGGRG